MQVAPQHIAETLSGTDYFRRSPSRLRGPAGHKEWQHFLVRSGDCELLVNLNLIDDPWAPGTSPSEAARLIVMVREHGWRGCVERFEPDAVEVVPGRLDARFGPNRLRWERGAYHLSFEAAALPVSGELELVPLTEPALVNNLPLSPACQLSWLVVPRLATRGTLRLGETEHRLDGAPAYHDHNWGRFGWGDDFAWEWGSLLPDDAAEPWSAVFVRMTDRGRRAARCQMLHLWRGAERRRVLLDHELEVRWLGSLRPERILRIPPVMGLLAPGSACDLPERLEVVGTQEGEQVRLVFEAEAVSQVVIPDDVQLDGVTVLNEVSGRVTLEGRVHGEELSMEARGVFEFVRP